MRDGPVISDNTPLVALGVLSRLGLLRELFGTVLIPPAVEAEFLDGPSEKRPEMLRQASWIRVQELQRPRLVRTFVGIDRGEAEVLALAEETNARLVLLDDKKARRFARRLERPCTGTVGLLLRAKEAGFVENVSEPLSALEAAGIHLGAPLVRKALHLAGEST